MDEIVLTAEDISRAFDFVEKHEIDVRPLAAEDILRALDLAAGFVPLSPICAPLLEWDAPRTHAAGAFPARAMR